jgi:nucleotide-binding universal stress UspA family protein
LLLSSAEIIMPVTHILVPTDFSDAAARALDYGSRLAAALRAELTVLHIVAPPTTHSWDGEATEAWLTDAQEALAEAVNAVGEQVSVVRGVVATGLEADEILDFTRCKGINLIVMGMHGHGRAARLVRGSVTNRVLRGAPCPVLAIPACAGEGHAPEGADDRLDLLDALTGRPDARLAF